MGLLDELYNDPNSMGLLAGGMGMMDAGGPSRMPVSLGQALNQGMRQGMGAYQNAQHNNMERQRFAQGNRMGNLQEQMLNMQLEGAKITDSRRKAFEQMLPQMPDDVKQAYMMAGPEKAFEMWNQKRLMEGFDSAINPPAAPAPRPYQNQTNPAEMRLDTPEQQSQLVRDYERLKQIDPAQAEQLREGLIQQGVIQPPTQPQQPDWNRVAQMSARAQLGGIKGATGMMELAKINKPDWQSVDSGGQIQFINKNSGQMPVIQKTMSPDATASNQLGWANYNAQNDPTLQGKIAQSKEVGKTTGEETTKAQFNLPSAIAKGEDALKLVDELRTHPGMGQAVGKSSMMGIQKIPGTEAFDFMNRLGQVKSGAFMTAFETLKGGGQITEVEGAKATAAIARMDNATSEPEFKKALADYERVIRNATNNAKLKAGNRVTQPANNPSTGAKFLGFE